MVGKQAISSQLSAQMKKSFLLNADDCMLTADS
jgi:hypothetical protein